MLPKRNRVEKALFKDILTLGRVFNTTHLSLRAIKENKKQESKFSFTVSKKVAKSAVDRNRIRRRGYAALALVWARIPDSFVGIFSAKSGIAAISFEDLSLEVKNILAGAKMLQ